MSAPPTVTAIIPTWNRAHIVRRAVHSALWQTFADLEVIVVDDASPDEARGVVWEHPARRVRGQLAWECPRSGVRRAAASPEAVVES